MRKMRFCLTAALIGLTLLLGAGINPALAQDNSLQDLQVQTDETATTEQPMVTDPGVYTAEAMAGLGVECRPAKSAANPNATDETVGDSIFETPVAGELPDMGTEVATGLAVPAGTCISEGLLVVRSVRYLQDGWEDVRAVNVPGDGSYVVYCGKHGQMAYDCWENYPGPNAAIYAACEQARGDLDTVDVPGAFNYLFVAVYYNGNLVTPDLVCA